MTPGSRAIAAAICIFSVIGIVSVAIADDQQPSVSQQKTDTATPKIATPKDAFCAGEGVPNNAPCPRGCKDGGCVGTCQDGFCTPPPP
jgi:hypothetical protein